MLAITEFIQKVGTYYLGTVDGDQPEVRPIGIFKEYDGKIYTAIGQHKKVFEQIMKNPKVVICATGEGGQWIRLRAVAKLASDDIVARVFEENPFLTRLYNQENGHKLGVMELTEATVEWCSMMGPERVEKL